MVLAIIRKALFRVDTEGEHGEYQQARKEKTSTMTDSAFHARVDDLMRQYLIYTFLEYSLRHATLVFS